MKTAPSDHSLIRGSACSHKEFTGVDQSTSDSSLVSSTPPSSSLENSPSSTLSSPTNWSVARMPAHRRQISPTGATGSGLYPLPLISLSGKCRQIEILLLSLRKAPTTGPADDGGRQGATRWWGCLYRPCSGHWIWPESEQLRERHGRGEETEMVDMMLNCTERAVQYFIMYMSI